MSLVQRQLRSFAARVVAATRAQAPAYAAMPARFFSDGASAGSFLAKDEVTQRVIETVKKFPKVDADKVAAGSHFVNDLGLDSLDTVEVVMAFEDEFCIEIPDAEAEKIASCQDAIEYVASHPQAK